MSNDESEMKTAENGVVQRPDDFIKSHDNGYYARGI